ncbi:hypothetical protein PFISCL1PPCAC_5497, partial [Pristionchus fissidentatus]
QVPTAVPHRRLSIVDQQSSAKLESQAFEYEAAVYDHDSDEKMAEIGEGNEMPEKKFLIHPKQDTLNDTYDEDEPIEGEKSPKRENERKRKLEEIPAGEKEESDGDASNNRDEDDEENVLIDDGEDVEGEVKKKKQRRSAEEIEREKMMEMEQEEVDPEESEDMVENHAKFCGVCSQIKNEEIRQKEYEKLEIDKVVVCDGCEVDHHVTCMDIQPIDVLHLDKVYCRACRGRDDQLVNTYKKEVADHRTNPYKPEGKLKPMEIGTKRWIRERMKIICDMFDFPPDSLFEVCRNGIEFKKKWNNNEKWKKVFLVKNLYGFGLFIKKPIDLESIIRGMGKDNLMVKVVDVYRQKPKRMSLDYFRELWDDPKIRARPLNILALEVSDTRLVGSVDMPHLHMLYGWAALVEREEKKRMIEANRERKERGEKVIKKEKKVNQRDLYFLFGMEGSFTNFHIDLGGSSVWNYLLSGRKFFFFAPPTQKNLDILKDYSNDKLRKERWLGDQLEGISRVEFKAGECLVMPGGMLHAVFTPEDSVMMGGNFLCDQAIDQQFTAHSTEVELQNDTEYLFPNFEKLSYGRAEMMGQDLNGKETRAPLFTLQSAIKMAENLRRIRSVEKKKKEEEDGVHEIDDEENEKPICFDKMKDVIVSDLTNVIYDHTLLLTGQTRAVDGIDNKIEGRIVMGADEMAALFKEKKENVKMFSFDEKPKMVRKSGGEEKKEK